MSGEDSATLAVWITDARERTLAVLDELDDVHLELPPYLPTLNPFRWEVGHVAWFHDYFVIQQGMNLETTDVDARNIYDSAAVGHERRWRQEPVPRTQLREYSNAVCDRIIEVLASAEPTPELRDLVLLAVFHSDMHSEAFCYMRQALGLPAPSAAAESTDSTVSADSADSAELGEMTKDGDVAIPGGEFRLGAKDADAFAFDNELGAHVVELPPFEIARLPVSQAELAAFADAGGYQAEALWSPVGWRWRQALSVEQPCYWRRDGGGGWVRRSFDVWRPVEPELPATHLSWYEADAWCRWAGRRLPTEAEWEAAASGMAGQDSFAGHRKHPWGEALPSTELANLDGRVLGCVPRSAHPAGDTPDGCRQLYGNVWEWTASTFEPYPGFKPGSYAEYSEPWFGARKVLRGGCWATRSRMLRNSLRNFFTPDRRDIYAGLRTCAL